MEDIDAGLPRLPIAGLPVNTVEQASATFNSPDADLELWCQPLSAGPDERGEYVFKAHRARLATVSTFFRDMFETAGSQDEALPKVHMSESWIIVYVLLLYAYNMPQLEDVLRKDTPAVDLLNIFEAADKYQIHALKVVCSTLLQLSSPCMDADTALSIYTQASLVGDKDLAEVMVARAAALPLCKISVDTLRELPATALHNLLCKHASQLRHAIINFEGWCDAEDYPADIRIALIPLYDLVADQ